MVMHSWGALTRLRAWLRLSALSIVIGLPAVAQVPGNERAALIAIYESTNGAAWTNNTGWTGEPGTECTWYGVSCIGGRVTAIVLRSNELDGTLPSQVGDLSNLENLTLSSNRLNGSIPSVIGNLSALRYLALDHNLLSGSIPAQLGNLSNLRDLYLYSNQLTGPIPVELGALTMLQRMWLSFNQLSGTIPAELGDLHDLQDLWLSSNHLSGSIPPELGKLSNLERLWLSSNKLSGSIPAELGNLSNLRRLWLELNELTGSIPPELGDMLSLEYLRLYSNQLSGSIPPELGKLANLERIWLSSNQLSGEIPPELGALPLLQRLLLSSNRLDGSIPSELGDLASLQELALDHNQLSGGIPGKLGSLTNLVQLSLSDNQLSGSIPADLGGLVNLEVLALDRNGLSGAIPASLGNLGGLQSLALDHNGLSGIIPSELGSLATLRYLAIDHNELSGNIPPELGNAAVLQSLWLSFNRLSGALPPELGSLTNLQDLHLDSNQLRGSIPAQLTHLTNLAAGSLNLSYNALFTDDESTRMFINARHAGGDFEATQTVAPPGVRAVVTTATSITLQWTLIRFGTFPGSYRAWVATAPSGPFSLIASTRDKVAAGAVLSSLSPFTTYYIRVDTLTRPHAFQTNTVVSEPGPLVVATTGAPAPEIVVASPPGNMAAFADGVSIAETTLSIANLGTDATSVTLTPSGSFFTIGTSSVSLAPASTASVEIRSFPVSTPGDYRGEIALSGVGVPANLTVPVTLFGAPAPSPGEVAIEVVATRVDVAAPIGTNPSGTVAFRNVGTTTAMGILQADQAWIVPEGSVLAIAPGATRAFSFAIDRSKRPDAELLSGSQEGTLFFVYVPAGTYAALGRGAFSGPPGLAAPVRIGDTIRPAGRDFCAGGCLNGVPLLKPGEVGLVVAGIGNVTGSVGVFVSNVTIASRSGLPIDDLALFFAGKAVEQPISAGRGTSLADVAQTAFEVTETIGALHLRTMSALELATSAIVFVKSNPAGTFGSALPVFRTDRGAVSGESITITGLRGTETTHTNLYVQEVQGADTRVRVVFLDADGTVLDAIDDLYVPGFGTAILGPAFVPESSVTARLTNVAGGGIAAFATPVDRVSNDTWVVADWVRVYGFAGTGRQIIPVAGSVPGRNDTYFQTDLAIHGRAAGTATVRYYQQTPTVSVLEESVTLAEGETRIFDDVVVSLFAAPIPSLGWIDVLPDEGTDLRITSRTYTIVSGSPATFGTGVPTLGEDEAIRLGQSVDFGGLEDSTAGTTERRTPATFRTNVGLVETAGAPVRVRVSVFLFDGTQLAAGGETAAREVDLAPRQWLQLNGVVGEVVGRDTRESTYGELRNVKVRVQIVSGDGAVIPYVTQTDNGTGDTVLRIE